MKKIISIILSAAVITASAAVPVFADYAGTEYDIEQFNYTFDDGTATNDIDGTKAIAVTDEQRPVEVADGNIFTNEFFLTFDFRYNTVGEAVPGFISIDKKKSSGALDKQGPLLSYNSGVLRTQTGSSSFQTLGEISPDVWYTAEIEGKMVVSDATAVFRLYKYDTGEKTLVQETTGFNLRQFYAGATNGVPNCIRAGNVDMDNIRFVSEYPDELALSSTTDEINAGTTAAFDYVAKRFDKEVTKHAVVWSVWDESGETEITDGSVTITADGVLAADISSPAQVVTVKATTEIGAEPLVGSYQISIKAVDTANEKFDTVVVEGADEIKAGTSESFTFTATKAGEDVTAEVTEEDIVWSVYNCDDLAENNNKNISIENGVLTVDDSVIAQEIYVRATSASGKVYGSKLVKINFSDSQKENVLWYDACETAIGTANRVESIDGSYAYLTTSTTTVAMDNHGEYIAIEFDFRMPGSGEFRIKRKDGSENSSFLYRDGTISQQTGGSSFVSIMTGVDTDAWYHMEVIYSSAAANASCNIYKYGENGELSHVNTTYELNMRNGKDFGRIDFGTGLYLDNLIITTALPTEVDVTSAGQYIFAGETAEFTATASRNSLPLKGYADFEWKVLDSDNLPIIDESVTVNAGLLTVSSMAQPQTVKVMVSTASGATDSAEIIIQTTEIFRITNLGVNEAGTKIVRLYVDKNFVYDDDVTFIITVKDAEGVLKAVKIVNSFGDRYSLGSNEITVDFELPSDFDAEKDIVETMVWTIL